MRYTLSLLLILALAACQPQSKPAAAEKTPALPAADADNGAIKLPEGFGAVVVAQVAPRTRHIVVNSNGDIYVKLEELKDGKGIFALRDQDGDGKAEIIEGFGDYPGTGIEIHGGYLYASSDTSIHRYKLADNQLLPADLKGEKIVGGFINQEGYHASKTFTFDQAGNMYVNVGAPSNTCQEKDRVPGSKGYDPCPQLERAGGIWRFKADVAGQTQVGDGVRYATGIRNAVAIQWNQGVSSLYALQHGRDQLHDMLPKSYSDSANAVLPSEEFLQISENDDFGWPYCHYNHLVGKKLLNPEYGGDGQTAGRCEGIKPPIVAFPGHMAPNDLLFYTGDLFPEKYKNGAFIAFHGSWNRAPLPQGGYMVAFVPMKDGKPNGEWEIFAEGFPGIPEVQSPGDAHYRPVGLAQGPDGSIYVSDSQQGRIWRIGYYGEKKVASR
ncbi:MAG: sorbosone dehydrogenase [Bacteroidetes bacterium]|nr:MAG: sorbosone dehydrogenase [Bacteroidota bacterium]